MHPQLTAALTLAAAVAAAAVLSVPRSAWADGEAMSDPAPFLGTGSRADVLTQLQQAGDAYARDAQWGEQSVGEAAVLKSTITRQQAREAYQAAREQANAITGEDGGSRYLKLHPQQPDTTVMGAPAQ